MTLRLTRRQLLTAAALMSGAVVAGLGGVAASWWFQSPGPSRQILSADEEAFLDAFAEAAFPPRAPGEAGPAVSGREVHLGLLVDSILTGMPATQAHLLRMALHGLDAEPLLSHGSRFHALPPEAAQAVVQGWLAHPLAELRSLAVSVHLFAGMAWLAHPEIAKDLVPMFGCGYGGAA